MRLILSIVVLALLAVMPAIAAETFSINYVSTEHVYVNGGQADGLAIGTRLLVLGPSGAKAELEVVYVSAHSVSCTVIGDRSTIVVGDRVQFKDLPQLDTVTSSQPETPEQAPVDTQIATVPLARPTRTTSPLAGSVSVLFYQYNDNTEPNLDFTQATTRLSLKARRLWGKELTLSIRGRGRFDKRQRDYRSDIEREDWENRLWEFSMAYEEPTSPVSLYVGRILPRRAGGVGYLDGLLLETRLSHGLSLGVLGGSAPDWMYAERTVSLTKVGGYFALRSGGFNEVNAEFNVGGLGEYHKSETNREYLFTQGRIGSGSRWGLSHLAEVDLNRGWRKDRAGQSVQLSNLFLNGWIRLNPSLRFNLSYDNRTNYWTFDSRSVLDSLFDDNLRQGVRLQSDLSLPHQIFSSASVGYRKRSGEVDATVSYSVHVRKANFMVSRLSVSTSFAGFDGPTNDGYNYSIRASRLFGARYTLGVGSGGYTYRTVSMPERRNNNWFEVTTQTEITRQYWLGLQVQIDSGDDLDGTRLQAELGYRF